MSRAAVVPAEVPSVEYAVDAYVQVCKQIEILEAAKARLGARILQGAPDPVESFPAPGFLTKLTCVYSKPRRLKAGVLETLLEDKSPQWLAKNFSYNPQWTLRIVGAGFNPNTFPPEFADANAYAKAIPSLIAAASL
jgi:hypothetical protein